ncbi:MAG TPA: peptidoglycan-associated lipoprotein Pal [Acidobacteriaceae bacterium]|nr:peptidoglycan-associated lipoprotein Pal [Acidobacteriaceae bacterium]
MNAPYRKHLVSLTAVAALLIAAGCHKKAAAPPPPPPPAASPEPTATITVQPDTINSGGTAVLTWKTTDATEISIEGMGAVAPEGTQKVSPADSTTYHLVARGPGGSADATARLTVNAPPAQAPQAAAETIDEQTFEQNVKPAFFDYDSYEIRPDAQATLAQDAAYLTAHPALKIVIGGYCDERGSAEYNLALGENRANSAKQSLVNAGIPADRIRTVSYGKEKQFCTQSNEACWQQNRRAGFSLDQ